MKEVNILRILGFSITRISKEDEHDAEVFKRVVTRLNDVCDDLLKFLRSPDGFAIDHSTVDKFIHSCDTIFSLGDIYSHNKFASPSVVFSVAETLDDLRDNIAEFGHVVMSINRFENIMENMSEDEINKSESSENIERFNELSNLMLNKTVTALVSELNCILHIISYDRERVLANVDIIRDYKRRNKEFRTGSSKCVNYVVKFKRPMPMNPAQDLSNKNKNKNKEGVKKHE